MKLTNKKLLAGQMEKKGISHRVLARYCGLKGAGMIDHLVAGRRTSCTPELAQRICDALDVTLDALFDPVLPTVRKVLVQRKAAA